MKFALITAALLTVVVPATAQGGTPLLRVYIDSPYFYDIMLTGSDMSETGRRVELALEGKEVGASTVDYNCGTGDYTETVTIPWTGGAEAFLPAALKAYDSLYC